MAVALFWADQSLAEARQLVDRELGMVQGSQEESSPLLLGPARPAGRLGLKES